MSTNELPSGWVGKPETHQAPGAFRVSRTYTVGTTWQSIAYIRGLSLAADVLTQVGRAGLESADVQDRAILKRVTVQNLDGSEDILVSEYATPGAGGLPAPTDAYLTAQSNGGVVTLDSSTLMQMTDVQALVTVGTANVNVQIWFDVPQAIR